MLQQEFNFPWVGLAVVNDEVFSLEIEFKEDYPPEGVRSFFNSVGVDRTQRGPVFLQDGNNLRIDKLSDLCGGCGHTVKTSADDFNSQWRNEFGRVVVMVKVDADIATYADTNDFVVIEPFNPCLHSWYNGVTVFVFR